jgi:hypothetical protein
VADATLEGSAAADGVGSFAVGAGVAPASDALALAGVGSTVVGVGSVVFGSALPAGAGAVGRIA